MVASDTQRFLVSPALTAPSLALVGGGRLLTVQELVKEYQACGGEFLRLTQAFTHSLMWVQRVSGALYYQRAATATLHLKAPDILTFLALLWKR